MELKNINCATSEIKDDPIKIQVTSIDVIVRKINGIPYYEIKYMKLGEDYYHIGYSSYDMETVFRWKDEYFELVNQ